MSIMIATPMFGGMCHAQHFLSCLDLRAEFARVGFPHSWCVLRNESLITRARNTCVQTFLESDHTHLLFIDADIEFTPEDVSKLWNLERDVSVGAYAMKDGSGKVGAWKDGKWLSKMDLAVFREPVTVDYGNTGFMMIARHVLETMPGPVYDEDGEKRMVFDTEIQDRTLLSEDYLFCQTCRDLGIEIWLDPSIQLKHWGQCGY